MKDFQTGLNKFIEPTLSVGPLNISCFVSQGYLVFCPDVYYTIGDVTGSVYNYVVSAAESMRQKPWVDGTRMGIQGHSFGGYEVNSLVTRTNIFAAAVSAAGMSDYVSLSGTIRLNGDDSHDYTIFSQSRLGASLWQDQSAYIRNSPVFAADKVTTPFLMMHSKNDNNVPWPQSVEYFTALRYLNKKVWMLQYNNGHHILYKEEDKLDYSIRLLQFFDHYLKGEPPPKWMTQGRPASLEQIDDCFEFDAEGSCGTDCKICKEKNYNISKNP